MALGASFYLLDTLEVPFCTLEMLQVCFKCVKKVKRSPKEPQGQLCFPDVACTCPKHSIARVFPRCYAFHMISSIKLCCYDPKGG